MILTKEEKELITRRRVEKTFKQVTLNKQKTCVHNFRCVGHSHNDDAYECTKCGYMEFH